MASITPKLKLKEYKTSEATLIFLKVYYKARRFVYSTGEKILPKYWDEVSGRAMLFDIPKNLKRVHQDVNFQLNRMENEAIKVFDHFIVQGIVPTNKEFKEQLNVALNKTPAVAVAKGTRFFDFVEGFIKESSVTKKDGTIGGYSDTLGKLYKFEYDTKYKIKFSTINLKFYYKFVEYLSKIPIGINTIGMKHIKNLKTFVHAAARRGIPINQEIDNPEFKKIWAETDKIYLTTDEVKKIFSLDLSDKPNLGGVRDLFIIGCNTALRYSDYSLLKKENIILHEGVEIIEKRTDKGDRKVAVPLNNMVKETLIKNNYILPKAFSNTMMNAYLRDIGKMAKINDEVLVTSYTGLQRIDSLKIKHSLITTHTARRSGATNMFLAGVPSLSIMMLTGHKTERIFMKYIRVNELEHAKHIASNPFFTQN